jgi:hypothetical protein
MPRKVHTYEDIRTLDDLRTAIADLTHVPGDAKLHCGFDLSFSMDNTGQPMNALYVIADLATKATVIVNSTAIENTLDPDSASPK